MIDYEKEIDRLLNEASNINDKSKIGLDTALFFDNEVTKLENILDNPKSSRDEMMDTLNKLHILYERIKHERNHVNDDLDKIKSIEEGMINIEKLKKKK